MKLSSVKGKMKRRKKTILVTFALVSMLYWLEGRAQKRKASRKSHLFKTARTPMPGYITMSDTKTETLPGDDRCVIVSCHDKKVMGIGLYWDYYRSFGYTMRRVEFGKVLAGENKTVQSWCRIPAVLETIKDFPDSRILYLDIDTKVNPRVWCNLPDVKEHAPIIMNSYLREVDKLIPGKYSMYGSQVLSNAFIVTPGQHGREAMEKWESAFDDSLFLHDQGVIHLREKGLCGVPGWIHCYRNPNQQRCHCAAIIGAAKQQCIRKLFKGEKDDCHIPL